MLTNIYLEGGKIRLEFTDFNHSKFGDTSSVGIKEEEDKEDSIANYNEEDEYDAFESKQDYSKDSEGSILRKKRALLN